MGYSSWVELHDHCVNHDLPAQNQTLVFTYVMAEPEGEEVKEVYKVRWDTIERNCWREIQEQRVDIGDN